MSRSMFHDIGILGTGLWEGPVVENHKITVADGVHRDPFKGQRGDDGLVRIAGLELHPQRHRRALAQIEQSYKDPYRGTVRRRICPRSVPPSEMEADAARRALADAGLQPGDVDAVLVQSFLSDHLQPKNASRLCALLGVHRALALNVDTLCNSAASQVLLGAALIQSRQARRVLCVQSTVFSCVADPGTSAAVQEADMASALLLGEVRGARLACSSHVEGRLHGAVRLDWAVPEGAAAGRRYYEPPVERMAILFDAGLKAEAMRDMAARAAPLCQEALARAELDIKGVGAFVCHQPLSWACALFADVLGLPDGVAIDVFPEYANIGSCSIAAGLHHARQAGRLGGGQALLLFAPAAGATYLAMALSS